MKKNLLLGATMLILLVVITIFALGRFSSNFSFVFKSDELSKIIGDNLPTNNGQYAVYVEDLRDGEVYSLRSSDIFPAASLYKIFLLAAVLKELEDGRLKLEDRISSKKDHLVEVFGEVDFGYEEAPEIIDYTVEETLQRVGRISDNFAAIILVEKIGWDKVQRMASDLGAKNTTIKEPIQTSAEDIAWFFKKLYQGRIVSPAVSGKIADYLSLSKINDRIPAKLPKDVKLIHKTGELSRVRHDGGIVYLKDRPYVIVLMSKDLKYEDEGGETLVRISKEVYEYFKKKYK